MFTIELIEGQPGAIPEGAERSLLERLSIGGIEEREAAARIAELEAQLAEAQKYNTFNGQYEEYITGEAFNAMEGYIQEKSRAEAAEARLKEAEEKYQIAFNNAQVVAGRLIEAGEQSAAAEARAEGWRKESESHAARATHLENSRDRYEADAGRLRAALESEVISLHKWHRHNCKDIYECQECADYEWTARMLAALSAEQSEESEG